MRSSSDLRPDRTQADHAEHALDDASRTGDVLRGRTILVADAHADTRELYTVCLQSAGARILQAPDGRDALVQAFGERPDGIVADCQLPFIDGLELCRLIRVDTMTARLPVVLVTTNAATAPVDTLWHAGADAAFTKPFPPESLISELARLIRSGRPPVVVAGAAADGDGDPAAPLRDRRRRRSGSLQPFLAPPALRCPICDGRLQYERSHAGGIGARGAEQWDYFSCARCGTFQYRHRTRKLRRVE
jgi:CheY-like chemotaxis protein